LVGRFRRPSLRGRGQQTAQEARSEGAAVQRAAAADVRRLVGEQRRAEGTRASYAANARISA
jgi:hypothetical protein